MYGTDEGTHTKNIPNYTYSQTTGNTNLRKHLRTLHAEEYDKAIAVNGWTYRSSTAVDTPVNTAHSDHNKRGPRDLPSFSPEAFLECLVRFIVADDQVSLDDFAFLHTLTSLQSIRVVECPEFRQLCMVLRDTLVETDIPRRDKMRESVLSKWQRSFQQLKSDLAVSGVFCLSALLTTFGHRHHVGGSVSLQTPGQTRT